MVRRKFYRTYAQWRIEVARWRDIRYARWRRAGFLEEEAAALADTGLQLRSTVGRRMRRARERLVRDMEFMEMTDEEIVDELTELYQRGSDNPYDWINEAYAA